MKRLAVILTLTMVLAACQSSDETDVGQGGDAPTADDADPPPSSDLDHSADTMAAAILQLITKDHTFGQGPPPFTSYLIQSQLDPAAGDASGSGEQPARALTDAEQAAIDVVVAPHGSVQFIDDPADWRTDDLAPVVEGAAILGVGEPTITDGTALVPVSLWCGGLCGTWLTYRLDLVDGSWQVTGIEGPVAIS